MKQLFYLPISGLLHSVLAKADVFGNILTNYQRYSQNMEMRNRWLIEGTWDNYLGLSVWIYNAFVKLISTHFQLF